MMNNRGQSEILGFIFIFSVVILSIGLLITTGAGNLSGLQETAKTDNAQNAMQILSDNIKEIHQRNAPTRATEIRLADTSVATANTTSIRVVDTSDNDLLDYDNSEEQQVLEYRTEQGTIVYDSGALIREDENGGVVMVDDPPFRFDDDFVMVNNVKLTNRFEVEGSSNILIKTEERQRQARYVEEDIQIIIDTTENRATAWEQYFIDQERLDESDVTVNNGQVRVTVEHNDGDTFAIRQSDIRITVQQ